MCLACGAMVAPGEFCEACSEQAPIPWPTQCDDCGITPSGGYHLCCTGYLCLLCYEIHKITEHGVPGGVDD